MKTERIRFHFKRKTLSERRGLFILHPKLNEFRSGLVGDVGYVGSRSGIINGEGVVEVVGIVELS